MNAEEFEGEITQFADVILPVPVPRLFTYRVPRELAGQLQMGARVIVQFGKTKIVTALIARVHTSPPKTYQAKYILELLDDTPLVTRQQLELFHWMAEYYCCTIGEVMNVALPSGLKISSQSKVQYNPDFQHPELLSDRETEVLEEIKRHDSLTYDELARLAEVKSVYHLIKSLVGKQAIIVFEEVREKYAPRVVRRLRLTPAYATHEAAIGLMSSLEKFPKQQEILMAYLRAVPLARHPAANQRGVAKTELTGGELSASSLDTLLKKGVFEAWDQIVSRFADDEGRPVVPPVLTARQQQTYTDILSQFQQHDTVLLRGITGSGKTEIYIHLIQQALESGSQVLYLLPEIALTTQIVVRLKRIFGEKVGIYHSRFSDNERVEVWKGILTGKFQFVVGVRSAIFLPFTQLGLIIVDEEHESSYKQFDPAPRYHARDVSLIIGKMQGAHVLLGSATPSLESYHQARQGRYGLVELLERYANAQLPDFKLIDLRAARKQKAVRGEFATELLEELQANLDRHEQTILFQNRRGYSPYLTCDDCGYIAKCDSCDVSLTYHQRDAEMRCHYCGHHEKVPRTCPACGSVKMRTQGFGTEKLEEELGLYLPTARIRRMDLDTTRSKTAFQQIISEFEEGQVDILVGTQMVTKGLDFDRVSRVAIFDADRMINFPDFRSTERSFQLITQVAGRAGRRADRQGLVLIQTASVDHPLLEKIRNNAYVQYFEDELQERETFLYPPFSRLIRLTIKHLEQPLAEKAALRLAEMLTAELGIDRVKGPEMPLVGRIRNMFLYDMLLKFERSLNLKAIKAFILEKVEEILTDRAFTGVRVVIDVDPM